MDGNWFANLLTKLKFLFLSRKFWAAITATMLVLTQVAEPEKVATEIAAIWIAFIFGTAVEDGLARRA